MKSKSNFPQRRAMRLRDYDYSQPGAYFCNHLCPTPEMSIWSNNRWENAIE